MTGEPHSFAQVFQAAAAFAAVSAGNGRVEPDGLALHRAGRDDARHLVAEHQGPLERGVADRTLAEPVDVRAADADAGDPDQALPVARHRVGRVDHPHVARGMQGRTPHRDRPPLGRVRPVDTAITFGRRCR